MFTGIIEEIGKINSIQTFGGHFGLEIKSNLIFKDSKRGDSINVNGVCLTISKIKNNLLSFDVVKETAALTNLGIQKRGSLVNLERALTAQGKIGGHFVTGHIDAKAKIVKFDKNENYIEFEIPHRLKRFIVEKGSVSLDGISLTVGKVTSLGFVIYLIPYTLKNTNLGIKKENDILNLECDILAKYAQKFLEKRDSPITFGFLKEHEFT